MNQLTKEQVLGCKLKSELVDAPEIGGAIRIDELTSLQADKLDEQNFTPGPSGTAVLKREGYNARWVIATARNADGTPMFTDADFAAVAALPSGLLRRLVNKAQALCGISEKAVEEESKNS